MSQATDQIIASASSNLNDQEDLEEKLMADLEAALMQVSPNGPTPAQDAEIKKLRAALSECRIIQVDIAADALMKLDNAGQWRTWIGVLDSAASELKQRTDAITKTAETAKAISKACGGLDDLIGLIKKTVAT